MAEYIEREAALAFPFANGRYDHKNADPHFINGCESYMEWLEAIPAADVVARDCYDRLLAENDELRKERPVVRCKDCKYSAVDFEDRRYCKLVTYYNHVPDDWFCADGKRKDSDGDA